MPVPNDEEKRRAELYADSPETEEMIAQMLAEYREELLLDFDRIAADMREMGQHAYADELNRMLGRARRGR